MMLLEELQRDDTLLSFRRGWKNEKAMRGRDWIVIEPKRAGSVFISESKITASGKKASLWKVYEVGRSIKTMRGTISTSKEIIAANKEQQLSLDHILEAIRESRKILSLKDDWDTEGSPGYSEKIWKRATNFLLGHARKLMERYAVRIPAPSILPGPDGSIDLHWKTQDYELLVNIPANNSEQASFYGDDKNRGFIKGNLDPATFNKGLLTWLMNEK
jgi:hypothetical protein